MPHQNESWSGLFGGRGELLEPWRQAWRGLADNPLSNYIHLSTARRERRVPPRLRVLISLLAALLVLALFWFSDTFANMDPEDIAALLWFTFSTLFFVLWLANGLSLAAREGLGVLSQPGKQALALQIDDMLSITRLSDHEIVVAALWNIWRQLQPKVVVGALLLSLDILIVNLLDSFSDDRFFTVLLLSPVTLLSVMLSGLLAVLICGLGLICAGRALAADKLATGAAIFLLLGNLSWPLMCIPLSDGPGLSTDFISSAGAQLLGVAAGCLVLIGAARLAELQAWMRVLWAVLGPVLLPVALACAGIGMGFVSLLADMYGYTPDWFGSNEALGHFFFSYIRSWGAFALVNPLALPTQLCLGGDDFGPYDSLLWPNLPVTLLVQIILIAVLAQFALRAVKLRRQGL